MKTDELELLIAEHFGIRTHLIVPNVFWGFGLRHEADLFVVTKSNYVYEVELKVSKSDLKADSKKSHKHIDPKDRIKRLYYAMPAEIYDPSLIPEDAGVLLAVKNKTNDNRRVRIERKPVDKKVRSITTKEYTKLMELCAMRVWSMKRKLIRVRKKNASN